MNNKKIQPVAKYMSRHRRRIIALMAALVVTPAGFAQDGIAIKATPLHQQPSFTSAVNLTLKQDQKFSIGRRKGGWYHASLTHSSGWVNMLSVRFIRQPYRPGNMGIGTLSSLVLTGHSGVTASTGVRGLKEEDLKQAQANFEALARMLSYRVSDKTAIDFAHASGLRATTIAYPEVQHEN